MPSKTRPNQTNSSEKSIKGSLLQENRLIFVALNTLPKETVRKFRCKDKKLEGYLHNVSYQDEKRNLAKVYVGCEGEDVISYFSLSAGQIDKEELLLIQYQLPYQQAYAE